jgi:hypothetical protein
VPQTTIVDIPAAEQARMVAELRRARSGYLLALPRLLLGAAGRPPSEIAAGLFCSRSRVYRVVKAYRAGTLSFGSPAAAEAGRVRVLTPTLPRARLALLGTVPRACGWCRTRGSCATLALELQVRRGVQVSAATVRRSSTSFPGKLGSRRGTSPGLGGYRGSYHGLFIELALSP